MNSKQQKTKPAKIFTQETIAPPKRGAWKVMLPLGLINFVAVAVIDQVKTISGNSSQGMELLCAAVAWGVCIAAWVGISLAGPLVADNRPRLDMDSFDIDPQI